MPVQLVRGRVQHPVEFEHGDRVLQLEAASQNGEPLLNLGLGFLGRLGEITDLGLALHLLREGVELTQRVRLGSAIVAGVACTFDHVTSSTRPPCSRMVMASSMTKSTPIMSASTASFWARSTSSTFSSIVAR